MSSEKWKFDFFVMMLQTSCGAFHQREKVMLQTSCGVERVKLVNIKINNFIGIINARDLFMVAFVNVLTNHGKYKGILQE